MPAKRLLAGSMPAWPATLGGGGKLANEEPYGDQSPPIWSPNDGYGEAPAAFPPMSPKSELRPPPAPVRLFRWPYGCVDRAIKCAKIPKTIIAHTTGGRCKASGNQKLHQPKIPSIGSLTSFGFGFTFSSLAFVGSTMPTVLDSRMTGSAALNASAARGGVSAMIFSK